MNTMRLFLHWPEGGVWSNLIASLLWAVPGFIYLHIKQHRHHKRVETKLEAIHQSVKRAKA